MADLTDEMRFREWYHEALRAPTWPEHTVEEIVRKGFLAGWRARAELERGLEESKSPTTTRLWVGEWT